MNPDWLQMVHFYKTESILAACFDFNLLFAALIVKKKHNVTYF